MGCGKSKSHVELEILTNFSKEELKKCYDDFKQKTANGKMDRTKFEDFYRTFFEQDPEMKFVDHLFRTFDFNNDGYVNFREFVCGLSIATRGTPDEKLTWTFNVYDVNNDGTITLDEMLDIMRAIYAMNGISEPEQLKNGRDAFQGLDSNGDGLISVAEFVKGVKRDQRLLEFLKKSVNLRRRL
uniref:EF-hand domain-containing protein n=1 Tax=Ciona savignyi TaxID=51511 RepID=H2Y667_CIOSA